MALARIPWLSPLKQHRIRREARELYEELRADDDAFVHPLWRDARPVFVDFVRTGVPADFLEHQLVRHLLYRTGFGDLEQIEVDYLMRTDPWLRERVLGYREPSFGRPVHDSGPTAGSVTALNKLYYFVRIAEVVELARVGTVVDFGGGYGLMCHIFRTLVSPPPTYVIVDLPEMLALQFTVLRSCGERDVVGHAAAPVVVRERAVNLVPVHVLPAADVRGDLFVSTFALSETPVVVQELIVDRDFLRADAAYMTGQHTQEEPWRDLELEDMERVRRAASERFDEVRIERFPVVNAWELTAVNAGLRRGR